MAEHPEENRATPNPNRQIEAPGKYQMLNGESTDSWRRWNGFVTPLAERLEMLFNQGRRKTTRSGRYRLYSWKPPLGFVRTPSYGPYESTEVLYLSLETCHRLVPIATLGWETVSSKPFALDDSLTTNLAVLLGEGFEVTTSWAPNFLKVKGPEVTSYHFPAELAQRLVSFVWEGKTIAPSTKHSCAEYIRYREAMRQIRFRPRSSKIGLSEEEITLGLERAQDAWLSGDADPELVLRCLEGREESIRATNAAVVHKKHSDRRREENEKAVAQYERDNEFGYNVEPREPDCGCCWGSSQEQIFT